MKNLLIKIDTFKNRKIFERQIKQSKAIAALKHFLFSPTQINWNSIPKHFSHDSVLLMARDYIRNKVNSVETINFGDSLTALAYKDLSEIDGKFAISASWHKHMYDMATDISAELSFFNRKKEVKYIVVGTLGGNPLLVYQQFDKTVEYSIKTLNKIRKLFPNQKIIVYGLPPVFNIHATKHTIDFDLKMLDWCNRDKNASFIFLKDKMGGFFPCARWSNDGVHLNRRGAKILNREIKKAKN